MPFGMGISRRLITGSSTLSCGSHRQTPFVRAPGRSSRGVDAPGSSAVKKLVKKRYEALVLD